MRIHAKWTKIFTSKECENEVEFARFELAKRICSWTGSKRRRAVGGFSTQAWRLVCLEFLSEFLRLGAWGWTVSVDEDQNPDTFLAVQSRGLPKEYWLS